MLVDSHDDVIMAHQKVQELTLKGGKNFIMGF